MDRRRFLMVLGLGSVLSGAGVALFNYSKKKSWYRGNSTFDQKEIRVGKRSRPTLFGNHYVTLEREFNLNALDIFFREERSYLTLALAVEKSSSYDYMRDWFSLMAKNKFLFNESAIIDFKSFLSDQRLSTKFLYLSGDEAIDLSDQEKDQVIELIIKREDLGLKTVFEGMALGRYRVTSQNFLGRSGAMLV
jgi:hypothetical protein